MRRRDLIAGPNFSGRSKELRARLEAAGRESFFVGPYAEAALSGLSSTVADEIEIYRARPARDRAPFAPVDLAGFRARKPATLSGGEQVLLALHCFSLSPYESIGIDTALEQLDARNRAAALDYLEAGAEFDAMLIDNRPERMSASWSRVECAASGAYPCDLDALLGHLRPRPAPVIAVTGMEFGYRAGRDIFHGLDLTLQPGTAYRLTGPNGAGKTTLFKLLVGVLAPARGAITLGGAAYEPRRQGNRAFALATQNPDHQWCGASLAEDMARRRKALGVHREIAVPGDEVLAALAAALGVRLDAAVYELPLAARKRVSWLWPFCGAMPWIMLDEPTIGQDGAIRMQLASAIARLCALGHGVVFVTHDDDFAASIAHRALRIEDRTIRG